MDEEGAYVKHEALEKQATVSKVGQPTSSQIH
jgi:hypothetical protein